MAALARERSFWLSSKKLPGGGSEVQQAARRRHYHTRYSGEKNPPKRVNHI